MSEHQWVQESLALFVAGGLNATDAARLERHLTECTECAQQLEEAQTLDRQLDALFAPVRPTSRMEEKVVHTLRQSRPRPLTRPQRNRNRRPVQRPITGRVKFLIALSALFFIAAGAVITGTFLDPGRGLNVAEFGSPQYKTFNTVGNAIGSAQEGRKDEFLSPDVDPARLQPDQEMNFDVDRIEKFSVPGKVKNDQAIGIADGDKAPTNLPAPGGFGSTGTGGATSLDGVAGNSWATPNAHGYVGRGGLPLPDSFFGRSGATRGKELRERGGTTDGPTLGWKGNDASTYFKPADGRNSSLERNEKLGDPKKQVQESGYEMDKASAQLTGAQKEPTPDDPPAATRKIIIRTGSMEFEVDSFDVAMAFITKLIVETKGAFINTANSEKLPNGKLRGSIVVRMPPEALDDFVLKLRRDLVKVGELRNQRIASQDVTKQYTDLESELRGARTMEERLLKIIRDGKGEIKDLLLAERELGNWRTKIEKIEGEMRYYSNQAALSTLSIELVEKELRLAASIEETERISTGIEVDDVEKARRDVLAAVAELKGRVLKSELKQHQAGQFSAELQFEMTPDSAGPMRDRLKMLGVTARLDIKHVQTAQGITPASARDIKTRHGDAIFDVSLYNLANVAPREIVQIRMAVPDVSATFRRLREEIKKNNGREITAFDRHADRQNSHAQIEFDVRRPEEIVILKKIAESGEELSREQKQRPQDANSTDAKVQIQLELVDAAGISPREQVKLLVEVEKVSDMQHKIEELVKAAKGQSFNIKRTTHGGKVVIEATHDVPLADLGVVVREAASAGVVREQTTTQNPHAPDGKLALGRLQLTLVTRDPLVEPDQSFGSQFRSGLSLSLKGLGYSLLWLVVGLLVFVPWLLVAYGCYRLIRRLWTTEDVELTPVTAPAPAEGEKANE